MTGNPDHGWPSYRSEHRDHYHALGVITSLFNDLEFHLLGIFARALKMKVSAAQRLFVLLTNHERIDVAREAIAANPDEALRDLINHFLDCYVIVADNRNLLAHSHLYGTESDPESAVFGKGSKRQPGVIGYVTMTVAVADHTDRCPCEDNGQPRTKSRNCGLDPRIRA